MENYLTFRGDLRIRRPLSRKLSRSFYAKYRAIVLLSQKEVTVCYLSTSSLHRGFSTLLKCIIIIITIELVGFPSDQ